MAAGRGIRGADAAEPFPLEAASFARSPRARRAPGRGGGGRTRPAHERGRPARPASRARRARARPLGAHRPRSHAAAAPSSWPTWVSPCASRGACRAGARSWPRPRTAVAERIPPRTARWKRRLLDLRRVRAPLLAGHALGADRAGPRGAALPGRARREGGALAQNLGLAAATSLVFLGGLELAARPSTERHRRRRPVADYIWDWREKMEGDFYVIRSEAVGWPPWEEINADGLRDRTHPVEKPPGRHRLVALGDSVTLGAASSPRRPIRSVSRPCCGGGPPGGRDERRPVGLVDPAGAPGLRAHRAPLSARPGAARRVPERPAGAAEQPRASARLAGRPVPRLGPGAAAGERARAGDPERRAVLHATGGAAGARGLRPLLRGGRRPAGRGAAGRSGVRPRGVPLPLPGRARGAPEPVAQRRSRPSAAAKASRSSTCCPPFSRWGRPASWTTTT